MHGVRSKSAHQSLSLAVPAHSVVTKSQGAATGVKRGASALMTVWRIHKRGKAHGCLRCIIIGHVRTHPESVHSAYSGSITSRAAGFVAEIDLGI